MVAVAIVHGSPVKTNANGLISVLLQYDSDDRVRNVSFHRSQSAQRCLALDPIPTQMMSAEIRNKMVKY